MFDLMGLLRAPWDVWGFVCVGVVALALCGSAAAETDPLEKQRAAASTVEPFDREACFDKVWHIINERFWDPNFNGVNWTEAGERYRPKALGAADHEAFAQTINQMLAELKTSHTRYLTKWEPDYYTLQAAVISQMLAARSTSDTSVLERDRPGLYSSQARPHRTGIGIVTTLIGGHHYVSRVLADSTAQKAGVLLGDLLLQVDGAPFHPIRSFEGKAGWEVELVLQRSPSASSRSTVTVTPVESEEKQLFEDDSETQTRIIEHRGHRFAYMPLWWLSGWKMRSVLDKGFDLACASEGMIVDLRHGFGGGPTINYIDPFLRVSLRNVVNESFLRDRRIIPSRVAFGGPVMVLINDGSRSGKELLAYYFRKTGRGVLLGERTAGYVSAGAPKRISEESLLYYCVAMITVDGKRLEGVGVEPDIKVPFDIRFATGNDVQLERAKQEIVKLIETAK